jgi:hypothetical protein
MNDHSGIIDQSDDRLDQKKKKPHRMHRGGAREGVVHVRWHVGRSLRSASPVPQGCAREPDAERFSYAPMFAISLTGTNTGMRAPGHVWSMNCFTLSD